MPLAPERRRNLGLTLVCSRPDCGTRFHPFRGRETQVPSYCSRECSRAAGVFAKTGAWPDSTATANHNTAPSRTATSNTPSATQIVTATANGPTLPLPPYDPNRDREEWIAEGARLAALADRLERVGTSRRREGRTIAVGGKGCWVGVEHDALVVAGGRTYGAPGKREVFHRASHDLAAVVVSEPAATITVPGMVWCRDEGVSLSILDEYGALLAATVPPPDRDYRDDVALRRRQYTLTPDERAALVRRILARKLAGQRRTLANVAGQALDLPVDARVQAAGRDGPLDVLDAALSWLDLPLGEQPPWLADLGILRTLEARCAHAYFGALETVPLRFARPDVTRGAVPPHWQTFGPRTSPLAPNGNARHAARPGQSILNYCYGCLESQARQALTAQGFDIAAGFLHADKPGRDSLVYDLLELRRAEVDALTLDFIGSQTFRVADFQRVGDGSVRLHPQLARLVVAACRVAQDRLDEDARWLRRIVMGQEAGDLCSATDSDSAGVAGGVDTVPALA